MAMRQTKRKKSIASAIRAQLGASRASSIIDLAVVREARATAEEIGATLREPEGLEARHAAYVTTHNLVGALAEVLARFQELDRHNTAWDEAEQEYEHGFPPMTPVTESFFQTWGHYDLGFGRPRETYATVLLESAREIGLDPDVAAILSRLSESRHGIYRTTGHEDGFVRMRELVTGAEPLALVPSGYIARPGELWLVRLLPPLIEGDDVWVAFTTPYIIEEPPPWEEFLARETRSVADYESLMKWGRSPRYWLEYVMQAYVNYEPGAVFLTGVPDDSRTRPHFDERGAAWLPNRK